jgi:hypothetical protein
VSLGAVRISVDLISRSGIDFPLMESHVGPCLTRARDFRPRSVFCLLTDFAPLRCWYQEAFSACEVSFPVVRLHSCRPQASAARCCSSADFIFPLLRAGDFSRFPLKRTGSSFPSRRSHRRRVRSLPPPPRPRFHFLLFIFDALGQAPAPVVVLGVRCSCRKP